MSLNETQYNNVPKSSKVFISYSHDSPQHKLCVLRLSNLLRNEGVDCNIDQYETSPTEGWFRWMINQIEEADFVLIVCTENYERRFKGKEEAGKGLGAKWEGAILTQELYYSEANNKCIPIVFSHEDSKYIPSIFKSATYYALNIEEINDETYDELYARLTSQKLVLKPDLGELRHLKPRNFYALVTDKYKEVMLNGNYKKPEIGELRTLFGQQITYFYYEKKALAKKVIEFLENEMKFNEEAKYCLLIDSGTTTYFLFCEICNKVIKYVMENNREGIETWIKRVLIITNNLQGIQYLMEHCKDGSDKYADLLIKCLLIPGKPLSVYAAVTGQEALDFLSGKHIKPIIRDKLGAKDDEYRIISFIAANYIVRHPSEKPGIGDSYCPVTRLEGHFEMKDAFARLSDEIYLISSLTKFSFATCKQLNELSGLYIDEQTQPEEAIKNPLNVMYREIKLTDDESRKKCTFFITEREREDIFWEFSKSLKAELVESYGYTKVQITDDFKLEQYMPVNRKSDNYRELEIEREVPHISLRNAYNEARKHGGGEFIWDKSWISYNSSRDSIIN